MGAQMATPATYSPAVYFKDSSFNQFAHRRCTSASLPYQTPWWMPNGHIETIASFALRRKPTVAYRRQHFITHNKGTIALDWDDSESSKVRG